MARWPKITGIVLALWGLAAFQAATAQDAADAQTQTRLKYPDVLYFIKDREPLHGKVLEETDDEVVFEAVQPETKATGKVRVKRAEIQKIEYFEDFCLDRAQQALDEKQFDEAKVWFNRAGTHITALPEDSPRKGKLQAVVSGLRRIDFMRAADLLAGGRAEEALAAFEQLYKADPAGPGLQKSISQILSGMAAALESKDKWEDARVAVQKLLGMYPDDASGRWHDETIKKHYQEIRTKAAGLIAQANAFVKAGQYKEAIAVVLESLNTDPNMPGARDLLADCRAKYQVLRYGDFEFPTSLHPLVAVKTAEKRIAQLLFDGLVDRSDRLESDVYFPRLAVKHESSPDNLVHTFTLMDGLRWSDGQPLTSADVAFTVRAMQNEQGEGYNKSWASWIKSVEAPDPLTVRITFARPACRPIALLAFKIVPRHKFSDEVPNRKSDFSFAPVGSGPFALAKTTKDEVVVLRRNEQFRLHAEGKPRLSEVDMKCYYDRVTARTDFMRGDLELLTQLEPLQVVELRRLGENKFVVKSHGTRTVYFLAMNFRRKIFQDPDMRRAIILAIDRHKIISQYFRGEEGGQAHRVISGPFPVGSWAYNDGKNPNIPMPGCQHTAKDAGCPLYDKDNPAKPMPEPEYHCDPATAKTLVEGLKARGLNLLLDISLKFPAGDLKVERACVEMRTALNDVGIRVRVEKRMENNLHDEVYGNADFDLVYTSYSFDDTMDVSPLFDFEQIGPYRPNFSAYKNPELNALFAEIRSTPDPLKITDLSWQIHAVVARDLAIIPLWQLDNYVAFKATVQGVKIHPYYLFGSPEEWSIGEQ